jgi:hypothetical protein
MIVQSLPSKHLNVLICCNNAHSEGAGDVALIKDDTYAVTCGARATNKPAWCLPENQIRKFDFGRVPSHMIVAARSNSRRRSLDQATINKIKEGLVSSMSYNCCSFRCNRRSRFRLRSHDILFYRLIRAQMLFRRGERSQLARESGWLDEWCHRL